jgi:hypothetical protein
MKLKLKVDTKDGTGERIFFTNLFVIAEWERIEGRKISDGRGIGVSDMACWAHILCKLAGDPVPVTWQDWLKAHPDVDIDIEDATNPNPTQGVTTDSN